MIILVMVNELMFVMLKNKTISVLKLVWEIYMNLAINKDNPTWKNINIMCQNEIFPSYNYFLSFKVIKLVKSRRLIIYTSISI